MDSKMIVDVEKAQELLKAGEKNAARAILLPIVQTNRDVAEAWYLLAFTFTDAEKRMFAFQQVLRIDPDNPSAQKQIAKLQAHHTSPVTPTARPAIKKEQKMHGWSILTWGLAGSIALLLCLTIAAGWWLSSNHLPVVTMPTWTAQYKHSIVTAGTPQATLQSTLTASTTPHPNATHTPAPSQTLPSTSTPTLLVNLTPVVLANGTSRSTPNLQAFKGEGTPAAGAESVSLDGPNWSSAAAGLSETKFGQLEAGESVSIPFDIDSAGQTIFSLQSLEPDALVFTLTDPDNQTIDQTYADNHPEEVSFGGTPALAMSTYTFQKTRPGKWLVNITASKAGGYKVFAILMSTNLLLTVGSDKPDYKQGETATFITYLYEKDNENTKTTGLTDAQVTLTLGFPDGSTEIISMQEYGNGVYATAYDMPDLNGFASATITAKGSHNGTNYTREMFLLLTIVPDDILLTEDHSDKIGEMDGEKTLDIQVGINAGHAGDFGVAAQLLAGEEIIATTNESVSLVPGHNVVTLHFRGEDIRHYRLDGPYKINMLPIADQHNGTYIDVTTNNTWETATYHWRDFGDPICFRLHTSINPENAGSIEISPAPNCPNGEYLSATLVTLKVTAKPGFKFTGWGGNMGGVNSSSQVITLQIQRNMVANAFFEEQP